MSTAPKPHFIFDFGAVLFRWRPHVLLAQVLPQRVTDEASARHWAAQIFQSYQGDWGDFDDGKVSVPMSNMRWCSDGFEIKCDSGETVTATFAKDCCDREILAWRAWEGKGLPGEPVRDMLVEAVERRFGAVEAIPHTCKLEFLTDNGSAYIAHETRGISRSLGLKPVTTPVCSPQSNGMAESFVNTFKRDYMSRMDLRDAPTVLAQLPGAFEHFNEIHPHSSLKMMSPREFRRRHNQSAHQG